MVIDPNGEVIDWLEGSQSEPYLMTKKMIRIHNLETNEIIDREMNAEEFAILFINFDNPLSGIEYNIYYWSSRIGVQEIRRYTPTCRDYEQLFVYEVECIGQDFYPLPQYTSALNFAFLSGELSYFAKSNIQNSVFPSFAMMFPKKLLEPVTVNTLL